MRQILLTMCVILVSCTATWAADRRVSEIIDGLDSKSPKRQMQAAATAVELGPLARDAVPALIRATQGADLALQHEAIIALGRIGPDAAAALPRLIELLNGDSVILKYSACQSIRSVGSRSNNRRALGALRRLASSRKPLIAVPAAWAMVSIRPDDPKITKFVVPVLVDGLQHASSHVAADAVGALGQIGGAAVPAVLQVMKSENSQVQCRCCDALAGMGLDGEPAVEPLIDLTQSDAGGTCRHAARALGMIGCRPKQSVPALARLLGHSDISVRINAAEALGAFASAAASAVPELTAAVSSKDSHLKRVAARALGEIGPAAAAAVPALDKALDASQGGVVLNAIEALGEIGVPGIKVLIKRLSDPNVAILAAGELSDLGAVAAPAVPALTRMLEAEDQTARIEATVALANIGPAARTAVPGLLKRLRSTDESGRGAAAYALGKLGAKSAVADLKQALKDKDQRVRMASAYALTMLDSEHRGDLRNVLPVLIDNLGHEMPLVRREMAEAVALLGDDALQAVPALVDRAADKDPTVRASALHALSQIAPADRRVLAVALTGLTDDTNSVRRTAAYALGRHGTAAQSAVPALKQMLRHPDPFDRAVAAWALIKIAPRPDFKKQAIGLLIEALRIENPRARAELATTLGQLGADPRSRKALQQLRADPDAAVREAAEAALKSFP